jgi:hypothetical protein
VYAERFIKFFDEYSQRMEANDVHLDEGEEGVVFSKELTPNEVPKEETKEEIEPELNATQ